MATVRRSPWREEGQGNGPSGAAPSRRPCNPPSVRCIQEDISQEEAGMSRPVCFIDIDTQRDFMLPGGALYVPRAETLLPALERLTRFAVDNGIPLISTMDAHETDDPEFARFPRHCVKDTPGYAKIPETLLPGHALISGE